MAPATETPEIALLVLNWNGADLLRRHLPSVVEAARNARVPTRAYVVDNASEDDSRRVVADFPEVEFVALQRNHKLQGYNVAVERIGCRAFMALNSDISPPPHAVDALWDVLRSEPGAFAVGGLVRDVEGGRIDSGPTAVRWEDEWTIEPAGLEGATGVADVAYVSGGAALYDREWFRSLGGFWTNLPSLYWEDVDLGLVAWLHGRRSLFAPGVEFAHESGATVKRTISPRRLELGVYRNRRLIHLSLLLDGNDLRGYLWAELRRSVRKPYYWPASLSLLPRLPAALRRRRRLRAACGPVSVAELERRWAPAPNASPT
ncbi:MAG TPA: glycosyltransferase family 2 protein [Solirubrobacteraceae bacterium]|nr:glycosyltransferase family 2 protein [Solirubrobacteraceae bacterium]